MARPESGFQLPLLVEFGGRPAENPISPYQPYSEGFITGQEGLGRFVREVQGEAFIRSPAEAATHLMNRIYTPFDKFDQEEIWSLLLNAKNQVTHEVMIYRGTLNSVHIRLAEVFKEAVRVNAASFIFSHCHPSGDPTPSPEDVVFNEKILQVSQLLEIPMLDHIVVGQDAWVSMKDRGLGFGRFETD